MYIKSLRIAVITVISIFSVFISGCAQKGDESGTQKRQTEAEVQHIKAEPVESAMSEELAEETAKEEKTAEKQTAEKTVLEESGWGDYFGELNGCAVFYQPATQQYRIYHPELGDVRRSPCSTFKIISSLIGLEEGVIASGDAVRPWSGESFWKEDWNRDIGFEDAFRASCVWYFRQVIDEIGQETMQAELDKLQYGNCDISDWQGTLNTNNSNPSLTGFWIESSLKISPVEQTEVLSRIFEEESLYSQENVARLKQVMQTTENDKVYGKTGLGMDMGEVVDAWFAGFLSKEEGNIYFCVYLGQSDGVEVSSTKAKEIALQIAEVF